MNTTTIEITTPAGIVTLEIGAYASDIDGRAVVQIDQISGPDELRINLNDGALWNGSSAAHDHTLCDCVAEFNG